MRPYWPARCSGCSGGLPTSAATSTSTAQTPHCRTPCPSTGRAAAARPPPKEAPMSTMTTLPEDVRTVLDRSLVCEYASLTKDGRPITWPLTAYVGPTGTLDVSTGLAYPDKAERA